MKGAVQYKSPCTAQSLGDCLDQTVQTQMYFRFGVCCYKSHIGLFQWSGP